MHVARYASALNVVIQCLLFPDMSVVRAKCRSCQHSTKHAKFAKDLENGQMVGIEGGLASAADLPALKIFIHQNNDSISNSRSK